jgi:hypothetical protein
MAPKKESNTNEDSIPIPTEQIEDGIRTVEETAEDVITQATKAVGTVMDLSRQASKLAASIGLGTSTEATNDIAREMENATGTLMNTSVDMIHAGSDAVKTTARIGVSAMNTGINLAKDLARVATGLVLLGGEVIQATGEIFEVSGKMIKTFGKLIANTGNAFK